MSDHPARVQPTPRWIQVMLLLALALVGVGFYLWIADPETTEAGEAGELHLLRPGDGATVADPVTIIFATSAPLELTPSGWMAGELHLHAAVEGRELMPAAADVRALGGRRFAWELGSMGRGRHEIRLYWADMQHRPLRESASNAVTITVEQESG